MSLKFTQRSCRLQDAILTNVWLCSRLGATGNAKEVPKPILSVFQSLSRKNRVSHSMQVPCSARNGQTGGKQGHTKQIRFSNRLLKAGSVAYPAYRYPIEPSYISDLSPTETFQASLSLGGRNGED